MGLPSVIIVVDDTVDNAKFINAALKKNIDKDELPERYWIYAYDGHASSNEARDHLDKKGKHFTNCFHCVDLRGCNDALKEIAERRLDDGVLVYLDVGLKHNICTNVDVAINSELVRTLKEWVSRDEKVLVHVHATDIHSGHLADAIDPSGDRVTSVGSVGRSRESVDLVWQQVVSRSIEKWRQTYPDSLYDQLWIGSTADWFKCPDRNEPTPDVPHTFDRHDENASRKMVEFVEGLFNRGTGRGHNRVALPGSWADPATASSQRLHEALKFMVGSVSCPQGGVGRRNLNLASAVLLLLATCAREGWDAAGSEVLVGWEAGIESEMPEIMSKHQGQQEARRATRALGELFRVITKHRRTGECTVSKIDLRRERLGIRLRFGQEWVPGAIVAAQEVIAGREITGSDFKRALREFLDASRTVQGEDKPRCEVRLDSTDDPDEVLFQIIPLGRK